MSRQEDFDKAADEYSVGCDEQDDRIYAELHFVKGCEYGYQYAVDKVCEWLRTHLGAPAGIPQAKTYNDAMRELITEFRKAMQ